MQQALISLMTCANPAVDLYEDPARVDSALSFMEAVQQSVTQRSAAVPGSVRGMHWLAAKASDDVLQTSGLLILLVAGPGQVGRSAPGGRSNEIVALHVDAAGFPVQRAPSPTAAVRQLLIQPIHNYKQTLQVHVPSLQHRARGPGSRDGWVLLEMWLDCMYSSRQPVRASRSPIRRAAMQQVPLAGPRAVIGADSLSSRRRRRSSSSSSSAAWLAPGNSILADIRQAAAANLPMNGTAAPGGSNSNSSSDAAVQQLQVRETELVQMLSWSAPAQLQQELLPRLHAAMQQLKCLPAGSPARTQFDANWAYMQAWRGAENKHRTLQFLLALINDALDSTAS
jgi:hypothetical protein